MLKCNTTHSPLVEPDMKISLIRLSRRPSFEGICMGPTHSCYKYTNPRRLKCS
jgi:hypothetical protein